MIKRISPLGVWMDFNPRVRWFKINSHIDNLSPFQLRTITPFIVGTVRSQSLTYHDSNYEWRQSSIAIDHGNKNIENVGDALARFPIRNVYGLGNASSPQYSTGSFDEEFMLNSGIIETDITHALTGKKHRLVAFNRESVGDNLTMMALHYGIDRFYDC